MLKMLVLISIDKPKAKGISQVSYYTYDDWGCPLVALSNLFNLTKTRKKGEKDNHLHIYPLLTFWSSPRSAKTNCTSFS